MFVPTSLHGINQGDNCRWQMPSGIIVDTRKKQTLKLVSQRPLLEKSLSWLPCWKELWLTVLTSNMRDEVKEKCGAEWGGRASAWCFQSQFCHFHHLHVRNVCCSLNNSSQSHWPTQLNRPTFSVFFKKKTNKYSIFNNSNSSGGGG